MGCNTSQELKTKDGAAIDAVSNGEPEPSAPQLELADGGGSKSSSNNHTNHAKSNSIISNGDAKSTAATATATATNGLDRSCDKTEITELNDDVEDEDEEPEVEILIPHHHHHHGSKKIRRNPLKNLDLDFKFDVNSF
ncbi:uncharacterized protein LOC133842193 isoform X2 [Drosophila sulfurigaster albostrigata]|uniref:Uncharacterized protein LOC117567939 isoform X2 n=1 Tax=Drosophila albomicans TaxID=7291 RepID=A0A9C6WET8_DROAB|nr:uncharacterized protein LOC117567939 isoform X2 [Drosophila albomicans]XP_062131178.1 uncharacterized protein LOC133842193 isoform X2 [Drosophila sulfurigaster albostrigata]